MNKKLSLKKKIRILTKNVNKLTNVFYDITNIEKKNDFKNYNSIIIIKNYDEIMNILKRHFENNVSNKKIIFVFQNNIILIDNNHVCFN